MRKIFTLAALAMISSACLTFTACSDDDKDNADSITEQLKTKTWASLAKDHPFMNNFPAYDGEIDNHVFGERTLVFFDYKCESSRYDAYVEKAKAAGFTDTTPEGFPAGSKIYSGEKIIDGYRYTVNVTYQAGNLSMSIAEIEK